MPRILTALVWICLLTPAVANARATGFLDRSVTVDGYAHRYQVYVPRHAPRHLPVILFLHGSGERGEDGLAQTDVGLGHAIRLHPERFPAIVVFPQAPVNGSWRDGGALALAALAQVERAFGTDRDRVYLIGISMGGNGVWQLGYQDPRRFAAIVAVCGFVAPLHGFPGVLPDGAADPAGEVARRVAGVPAWIEHGTADPVVPVAESRRMAAALASAGSPVRYVELPGVGHDAWDAAFADPALAEWLFARRRGMVK